MHSGFSPPSSLSQSQSNTGTMNTDISDLAPNTPAAPALPFTVIDTDTTREVRSRSPTPRRNEEHSLSPRFASPVHAQQDISSSSTVNPAQQARLRLLQQQLNEVMTVNSQLQQNQMQLNQQQQVSVTQHIVHEASMPDSTVHALLHAQESVFQAQAQQAVAAMAAQTHEAQSTVVAHANMALVEQERQLTHRFEEMLKQQMQQQAETMRVMFMQQLQKERDAHEVQTRAVRELASREIHQLRVELTSAQQAVAAVQAQAQAQPTNQNGAAQTLGVGSPILGPAQAAAQGSKSPKTPTNAPTAHVRIHSPDGLRQWYREPEPTAKLPDSPHIRNLLTEFENQSAPTAAVPPLFNPFASPMEPVSQMQILQQQVSQLGNLVQSLISAQVVPTPEPTPKVPKINLSSASVGQKGTKQSSGKDPSDSPSSSSSSESESSEDSGGGNSKKPPPPPCRKCGKTGHDEADCPEDGDDDDADKDAATTAQSKSKVTKEEDVVRIKDLEDMKFPAPPNDAARCRGYKNTVLTTIGGMQKTEGNEVYQWVLKCATAKLIKELESSEGFPVLDRKIGVKLQASAKDGKFGMMFQTMIEETRRKQGAMPKGRQMLWRVFNEFDLERQRGGMIGHQQLLNVRLKDSSIADLEQFRDKVVFIRSSMEDEDLPKDTTLELFLHQELKQHPKLTSMIDKYESSSLSSYRGSYEWLWTNMLAVITRHKTDANAQAVEKALQSSSSTSVPAVPGLA